MSTADLSRVVYHLEIPYLGSREPQAVLLIKTGRNNTVLRDWMLSEEYQRLAIVTSSNPGGAVASPEQNQRRWADLVYLANIATNNVARERAERGLSAHDWYIVRSRPGCGDEDHELQMAIPNIEREHAQQIAARFGQVAFVWVEIGFEGRLAQTRFTCIPELVMVQS